MIARPSSPPASPRASTVGITTAEACVTEGAWVSSKSSPWASVPLIMIAIGVLAVNLAPTTVHSPRPAHASSPARIGGPTSCADAASAMPRMSSARSFTSLTTAAGKSSNVRSAANAASRSASVISGSHDPNGANQAAFGVGQLELLGEAAFDQLLHEGLALLPGRRQLVRSPARDEASAAHVRQARLGALQ